MKLCDFKCGRVATVNVMAEVDISGSLCNPCYQEAKSEFKFLVLVDSKNLN